MNPALALNLFSDPGCSNAIPATGMPCEIGASLFKSLLAKENSSLGVAKKSLVHPGTAGEGSSGASGMNSSAGGKTTKSVTDGLSILGLPGLPIGFLKLAPESASRLISFLQGRGFSKEKSLAVVKSATDNDGFIHVSRLAAQLGNLEKTAQNIQKGLVISSRDVPEFQKFLFQIGIGAGDVKKLTEQSDDGKGDMMLSKLLPQLADKSPDMDTQEKLVSLLALNGIQCVSDDVPNRIGSSDLKEFLQEYAGTSSEDVQKHIKATLADLLREKGVPPGKVKSFLESMNVEYSKTLSQTGAGKAGKGATAAQIGLWNGIVIEPKNKMGNDSWTEKILAILKDVRTGDRKGEGTAQGKPLSDIHAGSAKVGSLLNAAKAVPLSKRHGKLPGDVMDSKITFGPGNTGAHTADPHAGAQNMLRAAPQDGTPGRAFQYPQSASPVPAILDKMEWMAEAGEQKARIQLSPPELGHIDLQLVIDHGHIRVQLGAENPLVKGMIESNLGQLKEQLAGLGFVVEEFSLHTGTDNRKSNGGHDLWEQNTRVGRVSGKRVAGSEGLAHETTPTQPKVDDRYQINVQV